MALAGLLAVVGLSMSCREARASSLDGCPEIIQAYFGDRAPQACSVSLCESTWRSWAISPDGANFGLFQVNAIHGLGASALDPETNVAFAYRLSKGGTDWSAWSCRP